MKLTAGQVAVYHKITIPGRKSRYSAWFDFTGFLLDAERIDSRNRVYPATPNEREHLRKGGWHAKQEAIIDGRTA